MGNLYNTLKSLCDQREITGYKMCKDCGIQPSVMTDLKMGRRSGLKAETAARIAAYFNVSVDYLLGNTEIKEKAPLKEEREIGNKELKFALFRGREDVTDEMLDEVQRFADMVALREEAQKKGK